MILLLGIAYKCFTSFRVCACACHRDEEFLRQELESAAVSDRDSDRDSDEIESEEEEEEEEKLYARLRLHQPTVAMRQLYRKAMAPGDPKEVSLSPLSRSIFLLPNFLPVDGISSVNYHVAIARRQ